MTTVQKPMPIVTPDTALFWDGCRNGQLLLQKCTVCESWRYPPALLCSHCGSFTSSWSHASCQGTIHSFVVYHRAFHPGYTDDVPYAVALVDLDEGVRMVMRVVGCSVKSLTIGMAGTIELRKVTEEIWVPVFVPTVEIPLHSVLPPSPKGE